jgi:uncharacterized repeat protein (TIGR03803 family)
MGAVIALLTFLVAGGFAQAQFTTLHAFSGGTDGLDPYAVSGLAMDRRGNLYGTTFYGGASSHGVVFRLTQSGSGWISTPLYSFQGGSDGAYPYSGVTIGPDNALYGATYNGGGSGCGNGCGVIYRVTPPISACRSALCGWNETVLYRFTGGADGANPHDGVVFDQSGNLYVTTVQGGNGFGTVFELVHGSGGWTPALVYSFAGGNDGSAPLSGVTLDSAGNLYGTTSTGGPFNQGTVYKVAPSGSGWTESVLYGFTGGSDGGGPFGGLVFDSAGNLYGTAADGGGNGGSAFAGIRPPIATGGTAFQLVPAGGGNWTFNLIYTFTGIDNTGLGPYANMIFGNDGNLYGTAGGGGIPPQLDGTVFKLTPAAGSWTYTSLHEFTGGNDGEDPFGSLIFDSSGNLYGTATYGGMYGSGVVFEITP